VPIEKALEDAKVEKESLFAIEIHGGSSRIPLIKSKIKEIFGKEPTQSLNPDECFAMGAGFQAAILSPQYVISMNVNDINSDRRIMISFSSHNGENKTMELFSRFQSIPSTKEVTIKIKDNNEISIFNDDCLIGTIIVSFPKGEKIKIKLKIRLNPDGIIEVHDVNEISEKDVEKPIKFEYKPCFGLSEKEIDDYISQEKEMKKKDDEEKEIDFIRNELENYIFKMESGMSRDFTNYFDPEKIQGYQKILNETHEWFSEYEFDRLSYKEYEEKLDGLKQLGDEVLKRMSFRNSLPDSFTMIKKRLSNCLDILNNNDDQHKHISQFKRKPLFDEIQKFSDLIESKSTELSKTPLYIDFDYNPEKSRSHMDYIEQRIKNLMNTPPPPLKTTEEEKKVEKSE